MPPLRLEVVPYVAGSSRVSSERNSGNPFDDGTAMVGRTGADVKYGIGSNLTLDVAVNPDFGQIDADPADVNLTVFETFLRERRPFFVEGSNKTIFFIFMPCRKLHAFIKDYFFNFQVNNPLHFLWDDLLLCLLRRPFCMCLENRVYERL